MARVLFVSKDIGGSKVIIPLVREVEKNGHEVIIVAEGLAAGMFEREHLPLHFKGTVHFGEELFSLNAASVLRKTMPNLVVVSSGSPIHLEYQFGEAASKCRIPFVVVEDFWNGSSRFFEIVPDAILTLDEYGKRLAKGRYRKASVHIVGNCGVFAAKPSPKAMSFFRRIRKRYSYVFAFVGGGDYTTVDLTLFLSCLAMTKTDWCLIPRFHPKCDKFKVSDAEDTTFGDVWRRMLGDLGGRVIYAPELSSEEVVSCADATVSAFSTLLATAAYAGKTAISIQTSEGMASLKEQSGLEEVPIVALGCAHAVKKPTDFSSLKPLSGSAIRKLVPYGPAAAYNVIRSFLE